MPRKQEKYAHNYFGEYISHEIVPVTISGRGLNWPFPSKGEPVHLIYPRFDNMAIYYKNGWQLYYMLDPDEQTKNIILNMTPQEIFSHADPTTLKSELVFGNKRYILAMARKTDGEYDSIFWDNTIPRKLVGMA